MSDVYHYARYFQTPRVFRRKDPSLPGKTEECLILIENNWPRLEHSVLGVSFTFMDFRTRFFDAVFFAGLEDENVNLNQVKQRFHALVNTSYLARTRQGRDYWEIIKNDRALHISPAGVEVKDRTLPEVAEPEHTGATDELLMQMIEDAKKKKADGTPDFDKLLSDLGLKDNKP